METYYPPTINRTAIMVMPKKPFVEWELNTFPDQKPVSADRTDFSSFLVSESEMEITVKGALKNHWQWIFENELNSICTDESRWPEHRTWKLFTEWFDIKLSTIVLDLVDAPVIREEF